MFEHGGTVAILASSSPRHHTPITRLASSMYVCRGSWPQLVVGSDYAYTASLCDPGARIMYTHVFVYRSAPLFSVLYLAFWGLRLGSWLSPRCDHTYVPPPRMWVLWTTAAAVRASEVEVSPKSMCWYILPFVSGFCFTLVLFVRRRHLFPST